MPGSSSPAAPAGDYQVRRAGPADHDGVTRELRAAYEDERRELQRLYY